MWPGSPSSQAKACCYTPALRSPLSSPDAEGASEGEQVNAMQPVGCRPVSFSASWGSASCLKSLHSWGNQSGF